MTVEDRDQLLNLGLLTVVHQLLTVEGSIYWNVPKGNPATPQLTKFAVSTEWHNKGLP
jgi:hypothetical protein